MSPGQRPAFEMLCLQGVTGSSPVSSTTKPQVRGHAEPTHTGSRYPRGSPRGVDAASRLAPGGPLVAAWVIATVHIPDLVAALQQHRA